MILRDDQVIEIFDSSEQPPDWIEAIDIENGEYQFCDDSGQRFVGVITRPAGILRQTEWRLRAEGKPNIKNALDLISKAKMIEPNPKFQDLESLKRHTTTAPTIRR